MKFKEAFGNIGNGKVIYLEDKPTILIACPLSMISIKPNICHYGIIVINTETNSETQYHVATEIKEFTAEEFDSDKWCVKSIKDCKCYDYFKKFIDENKDTIHKIIEDIQSIIYKYSDDDLNNMDIESKLYAMSTHHQLLEAMLSMRRVLMWLDEPYHYTEVVPFDR